jgi:hypothetical protein
MNIGETVALALDQAKCNMRQQELRSSASSSARIRKSAVSSSVASRRDNVP